MHRFTDPDPDREGAAAPAMSPVGPHIAAVLIVRDEERCIERCLSSVRPWVDEMIVLDTGSIDATPQIAARCGARVARFEWIDDFAAARNAALALTQAQWRLVIDADEWIEQGGRCLAELREQRGDFIGQVWVVSLLDGGAIRAPSWLPRVLPRGLRYSGRIHEQPESNLPRRRLALSIAHDGYLAEPMAAKAGRNRRLLERELVEQPDDAYLNYQLGKEFEVRLAFAEAAPRYRRAYHLSQSGAHALAAWRHDLVVRLLFTLKRVGALDEASALAEAEHRYWADSPDFHFTLGDLWLECALRRPQRAAELLPRIEASWLRALEIGERPELPDTVCGRGSYLAAHNLAVFHRSLGRLEQADRWEQQAQAMRLRNAPPAQSELAGPRRVVPRFGALAEP